MQRQVLASLHCSMVIPPAKCRGKPVANVVKVIAFAEIRSSRVGKGLLGQICTKLAQVKALQAANSGI